LSFVGKKGGAFKHEGDKGIHGFFTVTIPVRHYIGSG
jgi:hypothetical protein